MPKNNFPFTATYWQWLSDIIRKYSMSEFSQKEEQDYKKIVLPNAGLSLNETEGGFLDYYSLENCPELSTFILLIRRIVSKSSA